MKVASELGTQDHDSIERQPKSRSRIERTRIACSECKRRRAKCSGAPSPCEACKKSGSFCHFNRKLDSRRKVSMNTDELNSRIKYVLDGLLLALRFNPPHLVDQLLQTLRKSSLAPWDLAKEVRRHLQMIQDQGIVAPMKIDQDDLLSVALNAVVSLRPKRAEDGMEGDLEKHESQESVDGKSKPLSLETSATDLQKHGESSALASTECDSLQLPPLPSDTDSDSEYAVEALSEQLSATASSWTGDFPSTLSDGSFGNVQRKDSLHPTSLWWYQVPDPDAFRVDAPLITNAPLQNTLAAHRAFDPPLLDPRTDFCNFCMAVRNSGRRALANGISLERLTFWGRVDCELLFRGRIPGDDFNIPNWACEVARRFPPMTPTARMAFAVLLTKVMPYLIAPSEYTWSRLPINLRPTELQRQFAHDISISFLPIPALRDSLIKRSIDWLAELIRHGCGVRWPGSFGDIGAVKMTDAGNWFGQEVLPCLDTEMGSEFEPYMIKAVLFDASIGRRYLSEEFEQSCFELENWYASQSILKTWPELLGQIRLV